MNYMRVVFSYPDVPPLEIPDSNLLAVLVPREADHPQPLAELVEEALDQPIGAERLEKLVSASAQILLLVDDITRQTPAAGVLPSVFRRLLAGGARRENIRILIAAGTHSPMTPAELEKKLGAETLQRASVFLHYWKDENHLRRIGAADDGTPIKVNRVLGFTGGSSIVQPGVSGPEITGHTHWLSALYPGAEIIGFADNPVRREVE